MKAFTDIEQSKKLEEILPIRSADMKFPYFGDGQYGTTALFGEPIEFSGGKDIPCWSLAALFEVLPSFTIDSSDDHYFRAHCQRFSEWHDNPIDACYEMILKLHGQKLL